MATLEDRILGEKLHYYCSSSEDEDESGENTAQIVPEKAPPDTTKQRESCSVNTGPKGVLKDWQRYQQLQNEKREEQERERLQLIQKLSLTCKSELEQPQAGAAEQEVAIAQEEDDDFLREYMRRRMEEMMAQINARPHFGQLVQLEDGQAFLDAVDKEKSGVTVIVHIYAQGIPGCEAMNGCLQCLAGEYPQVKFCIVEASAAGMSRHFERKGVPALLVYKNGSLIGNFVRLTDEFGDDFFALDVESFLVEHGFLPDQSLVPTVRQPAIADDDDDDDR
uniref:Phosducin domain-containing protein n=1 Tax=Amblyomma maculatum TaxID=34609 RepID=G3MLG6_AMBMU